jgi:large subunit ribosomal protein L18e
MKTNVEKSSVKEWIAVLKEAQKNVKYAKLFKKVQRSLEIPSRERKNGVNLFKLNKYTKEGDVVIVPRKVLSTGSIDHRITIAAPEYSSRAVEALKKKGCKVIDIKDMVNEKRIGIII